nr:immunoglobulin heavy chain junction region [Macaca mulatta]MOV86812.1 immunoglobulin heavy chain junction region [Macaca mulatta]MOV86853.1 immunoglobulin heavy chain junction region [Macaca mulatta]MOV86903.1 immunoglobulin heavy chain junction region [Macaca mulatta]MOV87005.1 immunoglobulin heavy chain junction region [Macaca mulatta]
CARWQSGFDYW